MRGATAKCDPVAYAGEPILTKPAPETEHKPVPDAVRKPLTLTPVAKPPTLPAKVL